MIVQEKDMFRDVATILVAILLSAPLVAKITPFPASFHTQMVPTNGTSLYVRVGGKGPAVVLLHGFGFTGDMWAPLAIVLAKDHTVIVPDLRGMGMSDHPDTGYTKKNQAVDIAGIMDALKIQKADLYARPQAMHDAFEQFGALRQDAAENKALLAKGGKITMPVFAIGAEKFFGKNMADHMQFAASNVTSGIVPNSGHWIMEENRQATIKLVTDFLAK
jgi:pimeloyl-ACP methyl ester carboxylesterase